MLRRAALLPFTLIVCSTLFAAPSANEPWKALDSADGSTVFARHETSGVALDGKVYVIGGRHTRSLRVFDTTTKIWRSLANVPMELHHFQPVAIGSKIYAVGAMTCCYPTEPGVATIYVYDTVTDTWSESGTVPEGRVRGGAGAVFHDGWIYVVGGNEFGHSGGARPWFDRYNPTTDVWEVLPDALTARDHFQAGLVDDKIVVAGGRQTTYPNPANGTLKEVDLFDLDTGQWQVAARIPTERGGTVAVSYEREVIVLGGEIGSQKDALNTAEAYDVDDNTWRSLQPMITNRHGAAAAIVDSTLHVMAGSRERGGRPETALHETLNLTSTDNDDRDDDGLTNDNETALHGTDPDDADSDNDGINDGDEIAAGTSPLMADSDADGLNDAEEAARNTNPMRADSDGDGLLDGAEVNTHGTDPLLADSDGDRLTDGAEVDTHGSDPLLVDSDQDGVNDGDEVDAGTDPTTAETSGTDGGTVGGSADSGSDAATTGSTTTGQVDGGSGDGTADAGTSGSDATSAGSTDANGDTAGNADAGGETGATDDQKGDSSDSRRKRGGLGSLSGPLMIVMAGLALLTRRRRKT